MSKFIRISHQIWDASDTEYENIKEEKFIEDLPVEDVFETEEIFTLRNVCDSVFGLGNYSDFGWFISAEEILPNGDSKEYQFQLHGFTQREGNYLLRKIENIQMGKLAGPMRALAGQ